MSRLQPATQGPTRMAIKFKGVDFLEIDSLLSDDERLVRDNTRLFIEENLVPIIEQCNRDGRFPRELIRPMGELGFYGASLTGYGCAGMTAVEYGLMTQELERGDRGVRSSACSPAFACIPSTPSAAKSRSRSTCPRWRSAKSSAASASPNPTQAPT